MNRPLALYTENFVWQRRVVALAKRLLGRDLRGPQVVFNNLTAGLDVLKVPYVVNSHDIVPGTTACVLSGVRTLRWAIEQKRKGRIGTLIAGPNIVVPINDHSIIFDGSIDLFLVPSEWVAEFCESFKPGFKQTARVWPGGVVTVPLPNQKKIEYECLIYKKTINEGLYTDVLQLLDRLQISHTVIEYGKYDQEQYYKLLDRVNFAIFFSLSESQGMALHEAWMHNVPTLVWQINEQTAKTLPTSSVWPKSSAAPYLTPQCGGIFSTIEEFAAKLEYMRENLKKYNPRQYHISHFTPEISAKFFLDILKSVH